MTVTIHQTAIVEKGAELGQNVKIGPFCVVGPNVKLGDNVELKSHVVIENKVSIGENTVIHPFASIGGLPQNLTFHGAGAEVIIGKRNTIREYVTINLGTERDEMKTIVGDDCFLMTAAHVAHDCVIGNHVILTNGATLGGHVKIDDHVLVGGKAAIHQFVRIGKFVMIGGVSGVERDVVPFAMVIGNRARVVGLNIIGLKRNGFSDQNIYALKKAYNILFDSSGRNICTSIAELERISSGNEHVECLLAFLKAKTTRGICRAEDVFSNEEERV